MDHRRLVPRTDQVLADPRLAAAEQRLGRAAVRAAVRAAQQRARDGGLAPEQVADAAVAALPARAASMGPVINATEVLLHANLGRRRSSAGAAAAAMLAARPDRPGAAKLLERNGLIRSVRLGARCA